MSLSVEKGAQKLFDILYRDSSPPPGAPDISRRVSGATAPAPRRHQIIGIASEEEMRERAALIKQAKDAAAAKAPKHAANYLGPRRVICPCGAAFEVPRNYGKDAKKYCSGPCRKKYGGKVNGYKFSPEDDEKILTAYADAIGMTRRPALRALSEALGIPTWAVRRHALRLGAPSTQIFPIGRKPSAWSEAEKRIVSENAALSFAVISGKLREAGFSRSPTAIKIFIGRNIGRKPKATWSATYVAQRFGIDGHSVMRWIRQKLLRAEAADTARKSRQGGDAYSIAPADVREFIIRYVALIDFRKVDKFWLVEVLTGKEPEIVN